jgi:hypothetical protein
MGEMTVRGYTVKDFTDAFDRYLPPIEVEEDLQTRFQVIGV